MLPTSGTAASYLQSLRVGNYASSTIYARGRAIIRFRQTTGFDPLEVDVNQAIGWWVKLHLSPAARAVELSSIRSYCQWAIRHGHIAEDPTRLLDRPRMPRRVPRPIDDALLFRAIAGAPRDVRAILTLAAFCGLRACEVAALDWSDVRRETLLLNGKGAKQRVVPLHPIARNALDALTGKHRGPVITRRDLSLGAVPPYTICAYANRYLHSIGIEETLHQLRHRYATIVYQLSRDIRLTQSLLGHSSPTTTAQYAAWDTTQAAVVIAALPTPA